MTLVLFRRMTRIRAALTSVLGLGTSASGTVGASTLASAKLNRIAEIETVPVIRNPLPTPSFTVPSTATVLTNRNPTSCSLAERKVVTVFAPHAIGISLQNRTASITLSVL
jgi:hypothetical protein